MNASQTVLAGMEMLAWEVSPDEWSASLQARLEFLRQKFGDPNVDSLAFSELQSLRVEVNDLERERPARVLFTTTGLLVGETAKPWRTTWWHLTHMQIECAGWEAIRLKWQHIWGIAARRLMFPLPAGAIPHVSDMAETLLARNPYQSEIELVVDPDHPGRDA